MTKTKNPTKQGIKKTGKGGKMPPKERQFGQPNGNPRNDGRWKKEDSISYQYNRILRMTPSEFEKFKKKKNLTMAQKIAIMRISDAIGIGTNEALKNTVEITDRTEGKSQQNVDITSGGEKLPPKALVEFVDEQDKSPNSK